MIKFDIQQLIKLHSLLIQETGGVEGISNINLLDSAINSPFQTIYGKEAYVTTEQKIARITWGIVANHSFSDGNKRMGVLIMLLLLKLNDIAIKYEQKELIQVGIELASGSMKYNELLVWIETHKII
ncbi:Fic family protein [Cellulosilyticum sp. ST5]|uniref:type II toxin-antitoxin system death-on-curing family toxin n=1 Tax=unclassified Cellulosilyticum TaxID=2643091 RepID=UPI000F8EB358|nr:Fic family protein [Cellulosilyticum sp. WCF-2]QEH69055.1 type II toxin-antitoxin system death-on-curing family toxin [Cellulosilyticum sp. WCF-2]